MTEANVKSLIADLGLSFADSMNHRLLLLVEGDDDAAVWNSWFATFGMSSDCIAIDTRGFTNIGFYAESDFLRNLNVRPTVCSSLDGDTRNKAKAGAIAEANARNVAKDFGGIAFTLERECIDDYVLVPKVLARAWGREESAIVSSIEGFRRDWATRVASGKPIAVESKWVLDRLYPEFAGSDASPESIRRVAKSMLESEFPIEIKNRIAELRALSRP
ncbi:MAG: hypothetical protein HUU15_02465 [Candidatus Brocadiae bacterium]|nr:hypothetical protein [Candidatus Brocadiia bacterium]